MLITSSYTMGTLILAFRQYYDDKWCLFRLTGKLKERRPIVEERWDIETGKWKPDKTEVSATEIVGLFQPEDEARAIQITEAVTEFETRKLALSASMKTVIDDCVSGIISPAELKTRSDYAHALTVHMNGTIDGITDAFIAETRGSLERLLVGVKLATK